MRHVLPRCAALRYAGAESKRRFSRVLSHSLRAERAIKSSMWAYSLRRLLSAIPTLLAVVTVSFFMMRLTPGGPFDRERMLAPAVEANINKAYNLDQASARSAVRNLIESRTDGEEYWGAGDIHIAGLQRAIDVQKMVGAISGDVDATSLVDNAFLPDNLKALK